MAIKSFAHKGVEEVFVSGRSKKVGASYWQRMKRALDLMDGADSVADLQGAQGFHQLKGDRDGWCAMSVSGNWRLVFRFEKGESGDIEGVDFLDYH
jgi:proteic killer suppression protein